MHHPIQMKPADSENRNGKSIKNLKTKNPHLHIHQLTPSFGGRTQTVCGYVVQEDLGERRADDVQPVRYDRGVHHPA